MRRSHSDAVNRKLDHIRICLEKNVEPPTTTWFEEVTLIHKALPEVDLDEINTSVEFLGKKLSAPIIVSSMTGGHRVSEDINRTIAKVVEELGLGMGVGSQRVAIENPELEHTFRVVRKIAPSALIMGNIGFAQLLRDDFIDIVKRAIDMIDADAIIVHLNPLQEVIQPEGDTKFRGLLERLKELVSRIEVPVVVKEIGCGISKEVAKALEECGVDAIDVSGAGGTSFAIIEKYRLEGDKTMQTIADTFKTWGIPTALSLCEVRYATSLPLIASGGIRTGIDIAKAIALGADIAGIALPVLRAYYSEGERGIRELLGRLIMELRICMLLLGVKELKELKYVPIVLSQKFKNYLEQRRIKYTNEIRRKGLYTHS